MSNKAVGSSVDAVAGQTFLLGIPCRIQEGIFEGRRGTAYAYRNRKGALPTFINQFVPRS